MKIIQLTPGTGSFYCGACIRDEMLIKALRRRGDDAMIAPMYLPLMTDEPAQNIKPRIFFGGVNVYLQQKAALFRHTPRWLDACFDAPRLLGWAAQFAGMTKAAELGEMTLSMLNGEAGHQAKELEKLVEWLREEERPDVVSLSNVLLVGLAGRIKRALKVPVVCSLQGEDTFLDSLPEPYLTRAWQAAARAAQHVDAFIPVSAYYGGVMRERLSIPEAKLHVVHNGIDLEGYPTEPGPAPHAPTIGYLARMHHAKGLPTLVDAFILLKQKNTIPDLRLRIAGSITDADEPLVNAQREKLRAAGCAASAEFLPNLERKAKIDFLRGLTVFSVPATYGESFGLYLIEAMAAGVPVVQPRHAAFPELIERTGGGTLYEPFEPAHLAGALEALLLDPERARAIGLQGQRAAHAGFGADRMAAQVAEVYRQVLGLPGESVDSTLRGVG